jgi:regulator of replication initiation timing
MSSLQYQKFIAERARLLERIKELEEENAELRKRLGEPVTPTSATSKVIQNLSLQEKVTSCSLFHHGLYARQRAFP